MLGTLRLILRNIDISRRPSCECITPAKRSFNAQSGKSAEGSKAADCLRDASDAVRSKPGIQAAAVRDVADGTVKGNAAREGKSSHLSFAYSLRR